MHKEDSDMRKPLVPLVAAAATACIGLTAATAGAGAPVPETADAAPAGPGDIDVQVPDSNDRVDTYWTQERMRAAKPMPTPRIRRPPARAATGDDGVPEE